MKINLKDVIEAIEFEGELLTHYLNKNTGIIVYLEDEETSNYKAEDINNIDSYEEWERELIQGLYHLKEHPEEYIQLPTLDEIDEESTMIDFIQSIEENTKDKSELKELSIRKLREEIENLDKLAEWYDYREKSEYEIAKEWCIENNIDFQE